MSDKDKIIEVINDIRPFLNMDGGDIEFIKYDETNKVVYVKMYGACAACLAQDETLNNGLLLSIQEIVPSVREVINVPL